MFVPFRLDGYLIFNWVMIVAIFDTILEATKNLWLWCWHCKYEPVTELYLFNYNECIQEKGDGFDST